MKYIIKNIEMKIKLQEYKITKKFFQKLYFFFLLDNTFDSI